MSNTSIWTPVINKLDVPVEDVQLLLNYAEHHEELAKTDSVADPLLIPNALYALAATEMLRRSQMQVYVTPQKCEVQSYAHKIDAAFMRLLTENERVRYLKLQQQQALQIMLGNAITNQIAPGNSPLRRTLLVYNACTYIQDNSKNDVAPHIIYGCQVRVL